MQYALGVLTGLVIAVLVFVILTYFRRVIEHKMTIIQKQIEIKGPRPRGSVIFPPSDADEVRQQIIDKNSAEGRPTQITELLDQ